MSRWPHDDPASLKAFYGDPDRGEPGRQLVPVVPPFRMTYDGKPIKAIQFHRKAAPALAAALEAIWQHYGRDQQKIDALGISKFAGSYNPRKIRGSLTRWSNHAYGAAIDLNAEENGLYAKGNMPAAVVAAFEAQGAKWGGNYSGRKDPMHFEFVDNGKSSLGFIDMPQTDGDTDMADETGNTAEPAPDGAVVESLPEKLWKLVKSKTQWASSGTILTAIFGLLTDWRVLAVIMIAALAAYIIYERSKKP